MNLDFLIYKMGTVIPTIAPSSCLLHRIGCQGLAKDPLLSVCSLNVYSMKTSLLTFFPQRGLIRPKPHPVR